MHGSIEALERSRDVDRRSARLPTAWVGGTPAQPPSGGKYLRPAAGNDTRLDGRSPVLAMLPRLDGPAYQAVLRAASEGARVYAVVAERGDPPRMALLRERTVLVRMAEVVPATALLDDRSGWIWCGADGASTWRLELVGKQRHALRTLFLQLFWTRATRQLWRGGDEVRAIDAEPPPFELPPPPEDAPVRLTEVEEEVVPAPTAELLHLAGRPPSTSGPSRLWAAPGGGDHQVLEALVREGTEVVGGDLGLPLAGVDGAGGWLIAQGHAAALSVDLSAAQASDLRRVLEGAPTWRFAVGACLGDHARDRVWLRGASAAETPTELETIELPAVSSASLRAAASVVPSDLPDPSPLALTARYTLRVLPPLEPDGTSEASLVRAWRQVDADFHRRAHRLGVLLDEAEERQNGLLGAFARLKGAVRGFDRKRKKLIADAAALAEVAPSEQGPGEAVALRHQLESLEEQVAVLGSDLDDERRKAELEDAETQQRAEWEDRREQASQRLPRAKSELAAARQELAALEAELAALPASPAPVKGGKKRRKRTDAEVKRAALSDRIGKAQGTWDRYEGALERLEATLAEEFVFAGPPPTATTPRTRGSGPRFVERSGAPAAGPPLPGDALPSVGRLSEKGRQRFLVIERWEDLDEGEAEAERLGAGLVAARKDRRGEAA